MRSISSTIGLVVLGGFLCAACGSSSTSSVATGPQLQIVIASGAGSNAPPVRAVAGDALSLTVMIVASDGSTKPLPNGARIAWKSPGLVNALDPDSTVTSPLPAPSSTPTAAWLGNPGRADRNGNLASVLFLLDPGTVQDGTVDVVATVTGSGNDGTVKATIIVDPTPAGDWARGAQIYGAMGANCAKCHGETGHGSVAAAGASTYVIDGNTYDFPAPGLNAEAGSMAGDPAWNAALFAVSARSDIDNGGLTLRLPMPDWLTEVSPADHQPLSTQDFADMYAFLKTQTH